MTFGADDPPSIASTDADDHSQSTSGGETEDPSDISDDKRAAVAAAAAAAASSRPPVDHEALSLALKDKGNAALQAGHPLEAVRHYSDALDHTPTNAVILSNRALAYIKVENYGLAITDATRAVEADPSYAKGYYRRGTAEFALNKFKSARKDFRKVCSLKPKDRDARTRLSACDRAVKEAAFALAIKSDDSPPLSDTYDPGLIGMSGYDGPHPGGGTVPMTERESAKECGLFEPGKLPREFVLAAIERFKNQKLIHKRYVARLLIACKRYFENMSSLMRIPLPAEPPTDPGENGKEAAEFGTIKPRVTVCGDTHGQFYDVMHIFNMNGLPCRTNPYLFNGDFVDRGSFSVEVILTLLLFKMSDPECIYLHRGNHETKNMNRIYGFEGEVKAKYDDKIFELFLEVFCHLPLASVVADKVFVTHGGLSVKPGVTLDDVRKIPRGMEPPDSGLMSDLLWSDPQPFDGKSPSKRGVGYSFGPDITKDFLERNNLSLLVRSHEVKDEGYLVEHDGKTITVFSAPNYCDSMGNKGAYIHFDGTLEPKFTQYDAVPHPDIRPMAYSAGMGG
eukprot:CAMPEP_0183317252 /NCGR_PEP_ID=MMETSP0160_2-20130417/57408_1 /TAXON_ID=2839 ORGANISM="Odontella Sinensis, Strain Grunow 1884" /NCGR_SAMPLE_ID=MMETSP0160_2 /ASSEMBLY_ACC=CAM_ASM_000250 /LENGTH=564 /DNA_ID=CAMNT_0025483235 /DNA_START=40 /DNA_END=1731 /DNA_ORIENTATION=+